MNPWRYEPVADLDQSLVERLRRFPREPDMSVYALRSFAALLIRGWLRSYHRLEIVGREHLPREGSFILIANHASHLDALSLLSSLPLNKLHRAFPAAAQDYFFVNIPRLALAAVVVNALPFGRQTNVRQSLELCRQLLANPGNILVLFPEGTRTATGRMGEFKPGIGLLVAGTTIPVVPCHLAGAFDAWPRNKALPRPRRLHLRIGKPCTFASVASEREGAREVASELQRAVLKLGTAAEKP